MVFLSMRRLLSVIVLSLAAICFIAMAEPQNRIHEHSPTLPSDSAHNSNHETHPSALGSKTLSTVQAALSGSTKTVYASAMEALVSPMAIVYEATPSYLYEDSTRFENEDAFSVKTRKEKTVEELLEHSENSSGANGYYAKILQVSDLAWAFWAFAIPSSLRFWLSVIYTIYLFRSQLRATTSFVAKLVVFWLVRLDAKHGVGDRSRNGICAFASGSVTVAPNCAPVLAS
jgi:hypothetical protein